MKKILFIFLGVMMCILLCACVPQETEDENQINIVTSFYPMYIATLNVAEGAKDIQVQNLTAQTTGCLHDYQITTADMLKLSKADVFIINGDGMENFINKAVSTYKDLKIVNASEHVKEKHEEILGLDHDDEAHDDDEHKEEHLNLNPEHNHNHGDNSHYWVSISLYIEQIKNIRDGLSMYDPENAPIYQKNADDYIGKLTELKDRMHASIDDLPNKNIVTFHEAFEYFAEEFDLNIIAVIEREPGTYPSSRDVAEIINEIRDKDVNAIFVEPQYSRTAADTIARETNVNVYTLDPIVTGNLEKDAYINLMEENLKTLKEALS